jgi:hypothetical protein
MTVVPRAQMEAVTSETSLDLWEKSLICSGTEN